MDFHYADVIEKRPETDEDQEYQGPGMRFKFIPLTCKLLIAVLHQNQARLLCIPNSPENNTAEITEPVSQNIMAKYKQV